LSIRALVAKIWPDSVVLWCSDWNFGGFFGSCISSEPRLVQHVSDLHPIRTTPCLNELLSSCDSGWYGSSSSHSSAAHRSIWRQNTSLAAVAVPKRFLHLLWPPCV